MGENNTQKLFVLIGVPGSGKSTLACEMVEMLEDNTVHISRDNIRNEIGDRTYNKHSEKRVYKEYVSRIATALKLGYDVVADSTNLTRDKRNIYFAICEALSKAGLAEVDVIGVFVSTPLTLCLERNSARCGEARVPESVIEDMHSKIEEPSYTEGFKIILNKN